jgi:hypothetical protein
VIVRIENRLVVVVETKLSVRMGRGRAASNALSMTCYIHQKFGDGWDFGNQEVGLCVRRGWTSWRYTFVG